MIITYRPSDGDEQKWNFYPRKVMDDKAEEIEGHFKGTYDEFHIAVVQGLTRARRVLLWHLMREIHPSLLFEDVPRFAREELEVQFELPELAELRAQTLKAALPQANKDAALAYIDGEIAKLGGQPEGVAPQGKALPSGGTTTPSRSRSTATSRRRNSSG